MTAGRGRSAGRDDRAGRAGRAGRAAVAVLLVGGLGGLAQHVARADPAAAARVASATATGTSTATECTPGTVQYVADAPAALARLSSSTAWTLATGAGVVVAVVDSGVDVGNAHLAGAVLQGTDVVGLSGDTSGRADTAGHGTAIAGEIAARPVTGSGVVGVAPDATILPVRVYYSDDDAGKTAGTAPRTDRLAAGIRYAVGHGASIINVSISSTVDDPDLRDAVRDATASGALVVASAGNRLTTTDTTDSPRYPAAYPDVLGVAAVDDLDQVTEDSIHGAHVDVGAPGTNVLTAYHAAGDCLLAGGASSTSFATAYVSAAAALIAQRYPHESPAQWAYRLEVTASRVQIGSRDDLVGWGVIRPAEALALVDDGSAPGPDSPVHQRVAPPSGSAQVLGTGDREDPLLAARQGALWWLIGGVGVGVGALLLSRLPAARRR